MKKIDYNLLKEDVSVEQWENIMNETDVETAYAKFESKIHTLLDKHAPLKEKRIKKKDSP